MLVSDDTHSTSELDENKTEVVVSGVKARYIPETSEDEYDHELERPVPGVNTRWYFEMFLVVIGLILTGLATFFAYDQYTRSQQVSSLLTITPNIQETQEIDTGNLILSLGQSNAEATQEDQPIIEIVETIDTTATQDALDMTSTHAANATATQEASQVYATATARVHQTETALASFNQTATAEAFMSQTAIKSDALNEAETLTALAEVALADEIATQNTLNQTQTAVFFVTATAEAEDHLTATQVVNQTTTAEVYENWTATQIVHQTATAEAQLQAFNETAQAIAIENTATQQANLTATMNAYATATQQAIFAVTQQMRNTQQVISANRTATQRAVVTATARAANDENKICVVINGNRATTLELKDGRLGILLEPGSQVEIFGRTLVYVFNLSENMIAGLRSVQSIPSQCSDSTGYIITEQSIGQNIIVLDMESTGNQNFELNTLFTTSATRGVQLGLINQNSAVMSFSSDLQGLNIASDTPLSATCPGSVFRGTNILMTYNQDCDITIRKE